MKIACGIVLWAQPNATNTNGNNVRNVNNSGTVGNNNAANGNYGVAPALFIKPEALFPKENRSAQERKEH